MSTSVGNVSTACGVWVLLTYATLACSPDNQNPTPAAETSASATSFAGITSTSMQTGATQASTSSQSNTTTTATSASGMTSVSTSNTTATTSNPTAPSTTTSSTVSSSQAQTTATSDALASGSDGPTESTEGNDMTSTDSPATGGCAGADILCADFEDVAVGELPTGNSWVAAPGHCPTTGYEIGVDASSGSEGSQALVSSNASSSTNACALVADLGEQTDFWVRAMVKYMGAGPTNEHEITFFELGEHADQDDPEGRVGFRNDGCNDTDGSPFGGLEFNMTKGPGGEFTGCTGVPLEGNRWYCVEIHVVQSGSTTSGELYLDGEEQAFTNHGMAVEEVLADGSFRYLKLGAQTYGSINTGPLVLDDVSVSTARIPCP